MREVKERIRGHLSRVIDEEGQEPTRNREGIRKKVKERREGLRRGGEGGGDERTALKRNSSGKDKRSDRDGE